MSNRELWEGFVSAAQRKAVWASKADGGKGHPDNKKKKSKKEDVATEEGYSSYAQQKAVWASRADKKKGKNEARVECPKCDGKGCDHCDNKGYHIESVEVSEKHVYRFSTKTKQGNIRHSSKDDAGAKKAIEKRTGEKVQSMTYRGPVSSMPTRREDSDAVKAFLAKGGKIKKLPPAKAQGYHGKDDPGKDVKGVMDRPDTKAMGTRKKVKSMESKTFFELRSQLNESMLGHSDAEKLNGGKSKDPNFKSPESHIDHHHRQSGGHNKSGGDQDRHRYQVAKKLGYDV